MRPRWSRIVVASCGALAVAPALWMGSWWATTPDASPVIRRHPGVERCSTERVLVDGLALHADHAGEGVAADGAAASVLLAAAECEAMEQIPFEHLMEALALAEHGLAWIADHDRDEVALARLLDVWELAADQARVGGYVNLAVWAAVQSQAYERIDALLADPATVLAEADRTAARDRLVALANQAPEAGEIAVREEHDVWRVVGLGLSDPGAWPWAWTYAFDVPRILARTRDGRHPIEGEVTTDARTARVEAAVLAGALDLWLGCADGLPSLAALDAPDLDLDLERRRCVLVGRSGDEVRVATAR